MASFVCWVGRIPYDQIRACKFLIDLSKSWPKLVYLGRCCSKYLTRNKGIIIAGAVTGRQSITTENCYCTTPYPKFQHSRSCSVTPSVTGCVSLLNSCKVGLTISAGSGHIRYKTILPDDEALQTGAPQSNVCRSFRALGGNTVWSLQGSIVRGTGEEILLQ